MFLAGCNYVFGVDPPSHTDDDAPTGDAPWSRWSSPQEEQITLAFGDDDITLTGDRLVLFLNHFDAGAGKIYTSRRASVDLPFPAPTEVTELSNLGLGQVGTPRVSADGLTMVFFNEDPFLMGELNIATRASLDATWDYNRRFDELSSTASEQAGTLDGSGKYMVFSSSRTGVLDLYTASRVSTAADFGSVTPLAELNSDIIDTGPWLATDGLTLYFQRNPNTDVDIYVSHRTSLAEPFAPAEPMIEINTTTASEQDPWLSPDGRYLYYVSTDPATSTSKLLYLTRE